MHGGTVLDEDLEAMFGPGLAPVSNRPANDIYSKFEASHKPKPRRPQNKQLASGGSISSNSNFNNRTNVRYVPKFRMGIRPNGVFGYPHSQATGKDVPGPKYMSNDFPKSGPEFTFGMKRNKGCDLTPGPVEYATGVKRDGPFYTMGARLKDRNQSDKKISPAPNNYNIRSCIGQAPSMPINGVRRPPLKSMTTVPAPNAYSKPDTVTIPQRATMPYKRFPMHSGMPPS